MIEYNLDAAHSILYMQPTSALALAGVIIEVPTFTGWESFGALVAHFRLIRDHHKYVSKVAVVTDSTLVKLIESLASHFVAAEVRQFPWGETEVATQWVLGGS